MPSDAILEVSDLRGGYDATPVLHGIDLVVPQGSTVALLGRNGMGKSSTIKGIMGILPKCSCSVWLRGAEISGLDSAARAKAGLGYVPESRQVFRSLTVREHLEIAARPGVDGSAAWTPARLMDLFPVLGRRSKAMGNQLSGGEQQLLVIARALSTNPILLLLDEPTEGLAPSIVGEIAELLGRITSEPDAPSVLLVEQNLRFALRVAQSCVVLVDGEVAYRGSADELSGRLDLQQSLIGVGAA